MSTPDQRARDKDRDAAIEIVEAAWADGQIVEADRDHRVEQLLRAHTLAEVQMIVHDLQPPSPATAPASTSAPAPAPMPVPADLYGAADSAAYPTLAQVTASAPKAVRVVPLVVVAVVLAVIGAGFAGLVAAVSSVTSSGTDSGTSAQEAERVADVLSPAGFEELLGDMEAVNGSTEAFEAVLYPTYAVVYLPVDETSRRYSYWYWNGVPDELGSRGTSIYERYDLADVDIKVVVRLVKRVRGLVEEPTSWYAIVQAPEEDGAAIWAYASNEYSESEYVGATLDGKVVYDSSKH